MKSQSIKANLYSLSGMRYQSPLNCSTEKNNKWLANVSSSSSIKSAKVSAINVKPTEKKSSFEIVKALLLANNCHTIIYDSYFNAEQLNILNKLARASATLLSFRPNHHNLIMH